MDKFLYCKSCPKYHYFGTEEDYKNPIYVIPNEGGEPDATVYHTLEIIENIGNLILCEHLDETEYGFCILSK